MLNSITPPFNALENLTILYNLHVKMITIYPEENHVLLNFWLVRNTEWGRIIYDWFFQRGKKNALCQHMFVYTYVQLRRDRTFFWFQLDFMILHTFCTSFETIIIPSKIVYLVTFIIPCVDASEFLWIYYQCDSIPKQIYCSFVEILEKRHLLKHVNEVREICHPVS